LSKITPTKVLCFVATVFFFYPRISRADVITLDQALSEARERSPIVQNAKATSEEYHWKRTEQLSGFLPNISAVGSHFLNDRLPNVFQAGGFSLPTSVPFTFFGFNLVIPVFNGLQNVDLYSAASIESKAADLDYDWRGFQVDHQVKLSYYRVLAAKALAVVADQDVKNLEDHLRQVQDQLRAGTATKLDVLRVQVQLSNARSDKTNADDEISIRQRELAQSMGLGQGVPGSFKDAEGVLPNPSDEMIKKIEAAQLNTRPDIEADDLRTDAAEKQEQAAGHYWIPAFDILGNYSFVNGSSPDVFTTSNYSSTYFVAVSLRWNLFDGMKSYSRSKQSVARSNEARTSAESARLQLPTDFEVYRRRYRYNTEKFKARSEDVVSSQEAVRLARAGFGAGTETNTDVLDAELDLFRARANVINSQLDALDAQINFELAIGRNL
jgi:outer membrane protein TolC